MPPPPIPGAPAQVTPTAVSSPTAVADPAINRMTVSWQPPTSGPAPEWYTLGVLENGAQVGSFVCYAPCSQRTIDARPGVTASVQIRAANRAGASPVAISNTVPIARPCPLACVTVDANPNVGAGPAVGRARGFLHAIGPNTNPARIDALAPRHWRVSGYWNDGAGPGHAAAHGATLTYLLSDNWHFETTIGQGAAAPWADWGRYTTFIVDTMRALRDAGIAIEYWEIQNEPGTPGYFAPGVVPTTGLLLTQFEIAYQTIKAEDPNAKVVAPSLVVYSDRPGEPGTGLDLRTFLDFAVVKGLAFDAISFHDNHFAHRPDRYAPDGWGAAPAEVGHSIDRLRALLAERPELGTPAILVNEYGDPITNGLPGWTVGRIAALEAADVDQANRSCWGTCDDGWLDGLLAGDGETTYPNFWVYAFYAQMNGARAPVATSNSSVTAFGARAGDGTVRVLLGRHEGCNPEIQGPNCPNQPVLPTGNVTLEVRVPGLLAPLFNSVLVTTARIPAGASPLAAPVAVATNQLVVASAGAVPITLPAVGDGDAWQITIVPVL